MARVVGKDLFLEALDAIRQLQATTARHTEQLDFQASVAQRMRVTVAEQGQALRRHEEAIVQLRQRAEALEGDVRTLAESLVLSATTSRTMERQLGQLARIVTELATQSTVRFEDINARLERIEKKVS